MPKKGQVSLEACILGVTIAAAVVIMGFYLRDAIKGNWRANSDAFSGGQYEEGRSSYSGAFAFQNPTLLARQWQKGEGITDFLEDLSKEVLANFDLTADGEDEPPLQVPGWGKYASQN